MTRAPAEASVRPTAADQRIAELGALLVVTIWSLNFIVVKLAIRDLPPVGFALIRFALAALILLAVTRAWEGSLRMPLRDAAAVMALGGVGFGLYQMAWTHGLQLTTAGTSSLLIATTPIFTMLLSSAIGADTIGRGKVAGAALSFAGVALIIAAGSGLTVEGRILGELLTLVASVLWAVYLSFGSPFLRRHSPLLTTALAMTGGTLALAPIGLVEIAATDWSRVSPLALAGALVVSSLLAAALSNVIFFRAIRVLGPTRVANFQFLVPALALVLAALVLAEPIEPVQVAGGAAIVAGILVARRDVGPSGGTSRREPSPIEAEQIEPA